MRILPNNPVSVGTSAGNNQSINLLAGLPAQSPNTSITTREAAFMNGNASDRAISSAPGLCMPNQVEKTSATNWTYNVADGTRWRATRMSEFLNAYNDRPTLSVVKYNTGETTSGTTNYGAFDCTGSGSAYGGPYSFWITPGGRAPTAGNGWHIASAITNKVRIFVTNGTYTIYVRDGLNCGQALEFSSTNNIYP
jgi:hypothetical protein